MKRHHADWLLGKELPSIRFPKKPTFDSEEGKDNKKPTYA
jgi:hypothetical protein